jgi:hypothetical protein
VFELLDDLAGIINLDEVADATGFSGRTISRIACRSLANWLSKAVVAGSMAETVVYRSSPAQPCARCPDLVSDNCTYSKLARVQSGKALTGKELK